MLVIFLILSVLDGLMALYFFNNVLYKQKVNDRIPNILFLIAIACTTLFKIFLVPFSFSSNYINALIFMLFFLTTISMIYVLYTKTGRLSEKFFWVVIFSSVADSLMLISFFISIYLLILNPKTLTHIMAFQIIAQISLKLLQYLTLYVLTKYSSTIKYINSKMLTIMVFIWVIIRFFNYIIFGVILSLDPTVHKYFYLIVFILLVVQIIIFYLLIKFATQEQHVANLKLISEYEDLKYSYYLDLVKIQADLKALKHDFRNHLSVINALIRSNNNQSLIYYVKEIEYVLDSVESKFYTECVAIDSILTNKKNICDSKNIFTKININIMESINIPDIDLCIVLGNLLDNAIEACEKYPHQPFIEIVIFTKKNYLIIEVNNSSDNAFNIINNKYLSTKEGDMHGIGLSQIEKITTKYYGYYETTFEQHVFKSSVSLKNIKL